MERTIGLPYEEALFLDDVDAEAQAYWFTEPEGKQRRAPALCTPVPASSSARRTGLRLGACSGGQSSMGPAGQEGEQRFKPHWRVVDAGGGGKGPAALLAAFPGSLEQAQAILRLPPQMAGSSGHDALPPTRTSFLL